MNKNKSAILLIIPLTLLIVLSFGDVGNVFAAPVETEKPGKLTINNKIGGRIYVTFEGPKNYSFWVEEGKTVQIMEQGLYTYSFFADGEAVEKKVKLKRTATIVLKLVRGKLTINNKIGGILYLKLEGPRNYGFWVPPGRSFHGLVPGYYKYTYFADGGKEEGLIILKAKGGNFVMKIDKGKLKIKNSFPQNVFIAFSGKVPYSLWASPGLNLLEMRAGTYKYEYWADGQSHEGSINITKRGSSLILEPAR